MPVSARSGVPPLTSSSVGSLVTLSPSPSSQSSMAGLELSRALTTWTVEGGGEDEDEGKVRMRVRLRAGVRVGLTAGVTGERRGRGVGQGGGGGVTLRSGKE